MKTTNPWALAIRARRIERGMTRSTLAESCGVRPSTVGSWERGRTEPDAIHKSLLLTALGCASDAEFLEAGVGADPTATLATRGEGRPRNDPGIPFDGAALKLWRVACGFTQATLHEASGVPTSTICDLERGHRLPTAATLDALALTLGREPGDFAAPPAMTPVRGDGS